MPNTPCNPHDSVVINGNKPCNIHDSVVVSGEAGCNSHDSNVISNNDSGCKSHDSNVISRNDGGCDVHDSYVLQGSGESCSIHDSYVFDREGDELMGCGYHDSVVAMGPGDEPIFQSVPGVIEESPVQIAHVQPAPPVKNIPFSATAKGETMPQQEKIPLPPTIQAAPLPTAKPVSSMPPPTYNAPVPQPAQNTSQQNAANGGLADVLNVIYAYLQSVNGTAVLGRKNQDFISCVNEIRGHFEAMSKDMILCTNANFLALVKGNVLHLKNITLEVPMNDDIKKFIESFCILVSNWNNNMARNDELNTDLLLLDRMCKYWYSSRELIDVLKRLTERARNLSNFAIPPIALSEHYMRSLLKPGGGSTRPTTGPLLKTNNTANPAKEQGK